MSSNLKRLGENFLERFRPHAVLRVQTFFSKRPEMQSFAEDIVHELYREILSNAGAIAHQFFNASDEERTRILLGSLNFRALDALRKRKRHATVSIETQKVEHPSRELDPHQKAAQNEQNEAMSRGIRDALSDRERELIQLHYYEGRTLADIGSQFDVDPSTVSRWLAQARTKLVQVLRDWQIP